jgi:hypothetical protein
MKPILKVLIILLFRAAIPLEAQVAPQATSPTRISINGNLTYDARYSQMVEFYSGTTSQTANVSGDLGYATRSERAPTAITFGVGDNWTLSGPGYNTGPYENLALSQGIVREHWSLSLSNDVSYRNGSPITGFSGVPGTGEPISQPTPTPSDETILTLNTAMVNNITTASYSYKLSTFSSLSVSGAYNLLRFINGDGIDTDGLFADMGLTHRFGPRNSLIGSYAWGHFSYIDVAATIDLNTPSIGFQRTWGRRISTSVSAGPQWVSTSGVVPVSGSGGSSGGSTTSVPEQSSFGFFANATIAYTTRSAVTSLGYSHGVSGGGGYLYGSQGYNLAGSYSWQFGHNVASQLIVEVAGGWRRTNALSSLASLSLPVGLGAQANYDATYGSAQATRKLGRNFSVYASYTGTEQSSSTQVSANVLSGLWQVIGFGIGYTPQPRHLRH